MFKRRHMINLKCYLEINQICIIHIKCDFSRKLCGLLCYHVHRRFLNHRKLRFSLVLLLQDENASKYIAEGRARCIGPCGNKILLNMFQFYIGFIYIHSQGMAYSFIKPYLSNTYYNIYLGSYWIFRIKLKNVSKAFCILTRWTEALQ